jgi:N-acetylglucosamine kinase-like BadF-type ATPase
MASSGLILGIDGGGSKTLALLADADGRVLGRGLGGNANYQSAGFAAASRAVREAIARAAEDAGLGAEAGTHHPAPRIAALCLGLAGAAREEDKTLYREWTQTVFTGARVLIVNDAEIVLAAGTPDEWGVALICGTGSIAYGRDAAGQVARAGGWGYVLGDEGSGYAIGRGALQAVVHAADGRGPATHLTAVVLSHWGLAAPEELIRRVYRESTLPADIAALAPLVIATAEEDAVAAGIVAEAGRDLASALAAVIARLDITGPVPVALAGGLLVNFEVLRRAVIAAAVERKLHLEPILPVAEPAQGALRLARELIGV